MSRRYTQTRGLHVSLATMLMVTAALPASASASHGHPNPAFAYVNLTAPVAAAGGQVVPLINSGQDFDGVTFEGIPDGIGIAPVGDGSQEVDLYVAHEQSHVPFGGFADLEDSSILRLRLDLEARQVVDMTEVLPPSAGFIRFCSSFMAGPREGFADYTFFANEESNDWVTVPEGAPYGPDPAIAPYRQAGYSVFLNTRTGAYDELEKAGRHNHENLVVVPGGWRDLVALSGDDTFAAPSSQMYMLTSENERDLVRDDGQLWAFQVTSSNSVAVDPSDPFNDANDYLEIDQGEVLAGRFIRVPNAIARGRTDLPPQAALEQWSNDNNVFQFVRIEDIAYDPDDPRTVYFTDTGTTRLSEDPATGRLVRLSAGGTSTNGRIFKMVLNAKNPRVVDSLTIHTDALAIPAAEGGPMRNPDNLDVSAASIMVQEDVNDAKIWRYDMAAGTWSHVASVTHPTAPSAGESSGIVDASGWLGEGWWALDVQSHVNQYVEPGTFMYTHPSTGITDTYQKRREDGQLLLMQIPGS
ncbi:MAG: alkaline phosphatase PhoX [Candidatus Limnocylindria bacterium]